MDKTDRLRSALKQLICSADKGADADKAVSSLLEGSYSAWEVFEMAAEDISVQTGLNPAAAQAIDLIDELSRYVAVERMGQSPKLDTVQALGAYFNALFRGRHVEYSYLACLDERRKLIRCVFLGKGTPDRMAIHLRDIMQAAMRTGARYAALAHNHPGGTLVPSTQDVDFTRKAQNTLSLIDVVLCEHVISARGEYLGIIEAGYLQNNQ